MVACTRFPSLAGRRHSAASVGAVASPSARPRAAVSVWSAVSLSAVICFSATICPRSALAQPQDAAAGSASDVARDLFERGKAKWAANDFAEAAVLLAASNQQLPRPGTAMLLADAYERSGRLRAALDTFRLASQLARQSGNTQLEHRANTREAALLPRLSQLELRVSPPAPSGLLVTLNGVEVPADQLNTVLYLDAGNYVVEARAPGHRTFQSQVALTSDGPRPLGARVVPIGLVRGAEGDRSGEPAPGDASRSERDTLAWWVGGAGGALVLASVVSLAVALGKNGASKDHCGLDGGTLVDDDNVCTRRGADLRGQARTFAHLATAGGIVGLAGIGAGLAIHFTAPRAGEPEAAWMSWSATF
jgi:hypothetical protein